MSKNVQLNMNIRRMVHRLIIAIGIILAINIFLILMKLENDQYKDFQMKQFDKRSDSIRNLIEEDDFNNVFSAITQSSLQYCPSTPSNLVGRIRIKKPNSKFNAFDNKSFPKYKNYTLNADRWMPINCKARHRVAIIVPYKNRLNNLNYFLTNMHPFLQNQMLEYQIFIVEQSNNQM
jgi:hypothetical protein